MYMNPETELKNCDSVKSILMLLVVLGHSMGMWMTGGWGPFEASQPSVVLHYLADWISTIHVFGFTLTSGYIFYYVKYERGGYNKFLPFITSKIKRLIVPFLFILLVWVVPVYIYFYGFNWNLILHRYLLAESPNQLWFLLMLFWVFVFFYPVSNFAKQHPVAGTGIVLLYMIAGMGLTMIPNIFVIRTGLQYVLFFWIGFLIRQYGSNILMKIPSVAYIVIDVILFIVYEVLRSMDGFLYKIMFIGISLAVHIVGAVMSFVVLQRIVSRLKTKWNILNLLSRHSMTVYLVHQQIIYFSIKFIGGGVSPFILVSINFVVAISISLLFSEIMSKSKITRFLIGSK